MWGPSLVCVFKSTQNGYDMMDTAGVNFHNTKWTKMAAIVTVFSIQGHSFIGAAS